MIKSTAPALLALLLALSACKNEQAASSSEAAPADAKASAAAPAAKSDAPALGTIDTDTYVMQVHRAIPFLPKTDPLGTLKVKEGHRYVVLDISVKNKSNQPLEMGSIMMWSKVTDESGKALTGNLGALTAYMVDHPDVKQQEEYENLLSMEFAPGKTHRAIVLGVEVPNDVKTLVFTVPVKAEMNSETKQIKFPVNDL